MRKYRSYLLAWTLLLAAMAHGQTTTATLSGIVTDPSGAAAAGAEVTAIESATHLTRSAKANRDGFYTIVLLPPGRYNISTRLAGFTTVETRDILLQVSDHVALDFKLQVGQVRDSVTVTADTGKLQLQTESGERSEDITNRQVRDLAINGRNLMDLTKTMPGVVLGDDSWANINMNGTRATMKDLVLDGSSNVNPGANNQLDVTENPDAIQEMKVLTSNFQAEYGKAGGAIIQWTTRSGTSQFHGGTWYFRRHDSLNADTFFNNQIGQPRPLYRYNDYGYNIGGPVLLPRTRFNHDRNKLFFFWAQEFYWQANPATLNAIQVPTALERNGDFSQSKDGNGNPIVVKDPNTGAAFPGNVIPGSRWFSQGQKILSILPVPNNTTGGFRYNYTSQVSGGPTSREDILRIDYNLSDSTRLSGRLIHDPAETNQPYAGLANMTYNFPLSPLVLGSHPLNLSFNLTHTFSATLTNEFIFGPSWAHTGGTDPTGGLQKAKYGLSFPLLLNNTEGATMLPSMTFGGISNQTDPAFTVGVIPTNTRGGTLNFVDNLMKVVGNHTIKVGIFVQRGNQISRPLPGNTNASINFANNANNPLNTGDPYANALMGIYAQYTQANNMPTLNMRYYNVEPYLQDTWKVTRRLTLDYGLRVSWLPPYYDTNLQANFFVPTLYDPSKAVRLYAPVLVSGQRRAVDPVNAPSTLTLQNTLPAGYIGLDVPGVGNQLDGIAQASKGYPPGGFNGRGAQWGPRFGFAWDVNGKGRTVVRGGFGISYDRVQANIVSNESQQPPTITTTQLLYGNLADLGASTGQLSPSNAITVAPDGKVPNVESMSLGVQRVLGWGTVLDIAYVATFSHHLLQNRNINAVPYFATFQKAGQDPSLYANGVVPAVEPGLPAAYSAAGFSFEGDKALPSNFLVPYPGWGNISYYEAVGSSNYNALQVQLRRRLSKSLTFNAAYTWSKAFGTASADFGADNPYNTRAYNYGLETFDRTHLVAVSYVYNLPGAAKFAGGGRIAKTILDNWELAGISTYSSGQPGQMTLAINGVNAGQTILGSYTLTPNLYRLGGAPATANGLQINPSAYYVPGIGDIGPYPNAYMRLPSWTNHDVSIYKNIPLGREKERYMQLRLEMYNAPNHTEFSSFNSTVQLTTPSGAIGSAVLASYPNVSITNNLRPAGSTVQLGQFFGEYNATRSARVIQIAVKVYF